MYNNSDGVMACQEKADCCSWLPMRCGLSCLVITWSPWKRPC